MTDPNLDRRGSFDRTADPDLEDSSAQIWTSTATDGDLNSPFPVKSVISTRNPINLRSHIFGFIVCRRRNLRSTFRKSCCKSSKEEFQLYIYIDRTFLNRFFTSGFPNHLSIFHHIPIFIPMVCGFQKHHFCVQSRRGDHFYSRTLPLTSPRWRRTHSAPERNGDLDPVLLSSQSSSSKSGCRCPEFEIVVDEQEANHVHFFAQETSKSVFFVSKLSPNHWFTPVT